MATQTSVARRVISPVLRMSNGSVIAPQAFKGDKNSVPRYNVELLIEPSDLALFQVEINDKFEPLADIRSLAVEVGGEKWPTLIPIKDAVANELVNWPFLNGDKLKAKRELKGKKGDIYAGKFVIRASSGEGIAPALLSTLPNGAAKVLNRDAPSDLSLAKRLFVPGNYFRCELTLSAVVDNGDKNWIKFYLGGIQHVKEGEKLGGRSGASLERFAGLTGGVSASDPTKGMSDEIPS